MSRSIDLHKIIPIKLADRSAKARRPGLALSDILSFPKPDVRFNWYNKAGRCNAGREKRRESWLGNIFDSFPMLVPSSRKNKLF